MSQNRYFTLTHLSESIIQFKINSIDPTPSEFDEYLKIHTSEIFTSTRVALLYDISEGKFLTSEQRIRLGKMISQNADSMKKSIACVAYVNTSVMAGIILKGILLVSPMPVPSKVFTTTEGALAWCNEML
jgi:hypothetical protein